MDELRVGVVGVGQRAVLAGHASRPGLARVVSDADPAERGRCDAVFVLTPDYLHTEPVLHFLNTGVAVFVEKPMAISLEDCDAMLAAAKTTGTRLYVGHNLRHLPVLRKMRELIDSGAIGRVRSIWCRHFIGHGGDLLLQ
ncbi:Gfo/Idh/MocA family oxidoreductase [Actinospica sp. MGRD01-02]|uniref:Gfo/Idh/MocA family oxidoreductase n=1 Tax=Actinospica acidithermotolerans TaxID=2828514 RepID=A0A941II31_9ACTN|nr:Gfo/Idh/MocA family oxidoreductase [Actinospica acidithermotolerans]MBR7827894.1 Gfo/Idh/MocA family oxidoreductase [Actinospica acidithermotolerans]